MQKDTGNALGIALDVALTTNIQFWTAFGIASLLDRAFPTPVRRANVVQSTLMWQVMLQLLLFAYVYALLLPVFGHLGNPLWWLSTDPKKAFRTTHAAIHGMVLPLGLAWGSPNLLANLRILNQYSTGE